MRRAIVPHEDRHDSVDHLGPQVTIVLPERAPAGSRGLRIAHGAMLAAGLPHGVRSVKAPSQAAWGRPSCPNGHSEREAGIAGGSVERGLAQAAEVQMASEVLDWGSGSGTTNELSD